MVTLLTQWKSSHTWAVYSRVPATPDMNISGAMDLRPTQWKDWTVSGVRASLVFPRSSVYTPCACYPYYSMAPRPGLSALEKIDSFHVRCQRRILHISWHDFVSNDEVLSRTGWFDVPYIVRKRRLGLLGHVARLRNDVPANQTLQICTTTTNNNWITNTLQIFSKIKHKICHMIPASLYQMPCSMDNYA